jgi:hypothetical protein
MRKGNCLRLSILLILSCLAAFAQDFQPNPSAGAGSVLVNSKFGGQIFGFDIDQNGTEAF